MREAVIIDAVRSPIGRAFKGSLLDIRADDMLAQVTEQLLARVPGFDPKTLDEVLLGCGLAAGEQGGNLGRVIPVMLGLDEVPGLTLNRYCASSMQSTRMAQHAIETGDGRAYLSLGLEHVSRVRQPGPDPLEEERNPVFIEQGPGDGRWEDPRGRGATPNIFISMGETAENVASVTGVTRAQMDEYALRSQQLTADRAAEGFWAREIAPITLPDGSVISVDDSPRPGTTLEGLSELQPVFREDGTVTAGNCCPLNDGAAAVLIMEREHAESLGLRPKARILSTAVSALSPEIMGLGPVEASKRALERAGLDIEDIDLVEINEAFAAQVIASYEELKIPLEKVNPNGGAIALGHPFGMSGARITATLLNGLESTGQRYGLQAMCVAGGQGMAMIVERITE